MSVQFNTANARPITYNKSEELADWLNYFRQSRPYAVKSWICVPLSFYSLRIWNAVEGRSVRVYACEKFNDLLCTCDCPKKKLRNLTISTKTWEDTIANIKHCSRSRNGSFLHLVVRFNILEKKGNMWTDFFCWIDN